MKRPNRYPYSGKRRIFEKTILRVGYINASNIKSNNSIITFGDDEIVFSNEEVRNEQGKYLCPL